MMKTTSAGRGARSMEQHRESRTIPNPHGKSVQQIKMVLESVQKDGLCNK